MSSMSHPTFSGLIQDQSTFTFRNKTYDRIASTNGTGVGYGMLKEDFRARVDYALNTQNEYIIIDKMRLCDCCEGINSSHIPDIMILNDDQLRPNNANEIDWDSFVQRELGMDAEVSLENMELNEEVRQCLLLIRPPGSLTAIQEWFSECCGDS